jgi:hypothetical protein
MRTEDKNKNDSTLLGLNNLYVVIDIMNAKAIRQYCGKCSDAKNKPFAEIKPRQSHDDLLEFEF